jgi:hypothetical protein
MQAVFRYHKCEIIIRNMFGSVALIISPHFEGLQPATD